MYMILSYSLRQPIGTIKIHSIISFDRISLYRLTLYSYIVWRYYALSMDGFIICRWSVLFNWCPLCVLFALGQKIYGIPAFHSPDAYGSF